MARIKHVHLARERYEDLDLAIKELGTLWVLERVNQGLQYANKRRQEMHEKRHPNSEAHSARKEK